MEASERTSRPDEAEIYEKRIENIMKASQTHIVVATLIVTVTFAAGFTLPGGFESDPNSTNKGAAILLRNTAFCTFVVTDVIAFACSAGAMLVYFVMAEAILKLKDYQDLQQELHKLLKDLYQDATVLQSLAMVAVVIAFVTGLYATLAHSAALAIAICIIGCTSFLVLLWVIFRIAQLVAAIKAAIG